MRLIPCVALLAAVAACGDDTPSTQPHQQLANQMEVRYTVERLPALGGVQSRGMAINSEGSVAGGRPIPVTSAPSSASQVASQVPLKPVWPVTTTGRPDQNWGLAMHHLLARAA